MSIRNIVRYLARRVLRTGDVTETLRKRRLSLKKRFYRQAFSLDDVRVLFAKLGFDRGRVIWVQSSWNEFYNLSAKPSEILALMRDMLGPEGTLVMPAFPVDQDPAKILEIDYAASSSGLLTEIFRRQSEVLRSIHLSSSVCAVGPAADFLVRDHHRDIFPWGLQSPFCRLMEVDARFVCLGIGPFVRNLTPLHAVECLLYDDVPFFHKAFDGTITYKWRRKSGEEGAHTYLRRVGQLNLGPYGRHFATNSYVQCRLSSLDAFAIDAKTAIDRALELGRRGITIYKDLKP